MKEKDSMTAENRKPDIRAVPDPEVQIYYLYHTHSRGLIKYRMKRAMLDGSFSDTVRYSCLPEVNRFDKTRKVLAF